MAHTPARRQPAVIRCLVVSCSLTDLPTADEDVNDQDVKNLAKAVEQLSWRFDPDEAQSVRLWVLRHLPLVFIYQEHKAAWPAVNAASQSASAVPAMTPAASDLPDASAIHAAEAAALQAAVEAAAAPAAAEGAAPTVTDEGGWNVAQLNTLQCVWIMHRPAKLQLRNGPSRRCVQAHSEGHQFADWQISA